MMTFRSNPHICNQDGINHHWDCTADSMPAGETGWLAWGRPVDVRWGLTAENVQSAGFESLYAEWSNPYTEYAGLDIAVNNTGPPGG